MNLINILNSSFYFFNGVKMLRGFEHPTQPLHPRSTGIVIIYLIDYCYNNNTNLLIRHNNSSENVQQNISSSDFRIGRCTAS